MKHNSIQFLIRLFHFFQLEANETFFTNVDSFIEISHEYDYVDPDPDRRPDPAVSFNRAWQTLAIMLSISVMLAVFVVIMLQVMKLLQGRTNLPSLSSLEMQSEHDRLQSKRYSVANYSERGGRPSCQVMLSSKKLDVNSRRAPSFASGGASRRSNTIM